VDPVWRPAVEDIATRLEYTVSLLEDSLPPVMPPVPKEAWRALHDRVDGKQELRPIADQFAFIDKVTTDLGKVSGPLHMALSAQQQEVGINPLF
jgi:hypothetical protein